ncbi:serpin family protein [Nocardioides sp.]|uniref:serpin family protein n=1 Tax=Nocardioides sp. TaxID=35761 RepID=UPI003D122979
MTRRDALRLLAVLAAVAGSPALLAACGTEQDRPQGRSEGDDVTELVSSEEERSPGRVESLPEAVASISALGGGVYAELSRQPGNLAVSPYSVVVALAMTLNGAAGATAAEMRSVLGVSDLDDFNGGLDALTLHIEGLAGTQRRADGSEAELVLAAANALFGQRDTTWQEPFLDALARYYGAGMRQVDFVGDTEGARTVINDWTAEQTRDRIPQILPAGALDELTRLVLVNAIYLKAPWEEPFFASATAAKPFTTDDGRTVQADTMTVGLATSGYARDDDWQAVRLLYAGGQLAMTILLPAEGRLAAVSDLVAGGGLGEILGANRDAKVRLWMPKWEFRTQAMLAPILGALGMPTAFTEAADFSAITTTEEVHLSAVVHEAFIAVDEEGTEAAAATAVVAGTTSMPQYVDVNVDRAFLFVIHDVAHGTPLFLGRVGDPTAG